MNIKNNYFQNRIASLENERQGLAIREINTLLILERITGHNFFSSSTSILDLGCGDKFLKPQVEKYSKSYTGLDIEDINFDTPGISFNIQNIDLFLAYSLIEHLADPTFLLEAILETKSNNSQYLVVECPNWRYSFKDFYNDPTHVKPYTPLSLRQLFESFGFHTIGIYPNLRCKAEFFYTNKYNFKLASLLPFGGQSHVPVPSLLKGRAIGMFGIFKL